MTRIIKLADGSDWTCDTPESIRSRISALQESSIAAGDEYARNVSALNSCLAYIQNDCPHEGVIEIQGDRMCADCRKNMT